jgi:trans-aconitate methyltransferase
MTPPSNKPKPFRHPIDTAFDTSRRARIFAQFRRMPRFAMKRYLGLIAFEISPSKRQVTILDVGCGSGRFAIPFLTEFSRSISTLVAIDRSSAMIRQLIHQIPPKERLRILAMKSDFFDYQSSIRFNAVFASEVLQFMPNLDWFLTRVRSLLKRNGIFAVRAPSHRQMKQHEWYRYFPEALAIDLTRHYDHSEIIKAAKVIGLTHISTSVIDESMKFPVEEYIASLQGKCFSPLFLIPAESFAAGIKNLKRDLRSRRQFIRHMPQSLLLFRKNDV